MKNDELGRLREENKRLSRENEYLRHRVEQLGERKRESGREDAIMAERLATVHTSRVSGYLDFAFLRLRTSRWFRIYDKTSFAVRGLLLASKLFRIGMGIFALVGIGVDLPKNDLGELSLLYRSGICRRNGKDAEVAE